MFVRAAHRGSTTVAPMRLRSEPTHPKSSRHSRDRKGGFHLKHLRVILLSLGLVLALAAIWTVAFAQNSDPMSSTAPSYDQNQSAAPSGSSTVTRDNSTPSSSGSATGTEQPSAPAPSTVAPNTTEPTATCPPAEVAPAPSTPEPGATCPPAEAAPAPSTQPEVTPPSPAPETTAPAVTTPSPAPSQHVYTTPSTRGGAGMGTMRYHRYYPYSRSAGYGRAGTLPRTGGDPTPLMALGFSLIGSGAWALRKRS